MVSRRIRLRATNLEVVRALGADRSMILADDLIGTLGAVLVGSLLAGLVAIALSPVAPLGPVRRSSTRVSIQTGPSSDSVWLPWSWPSSIVATVVSFLSLPGRARMRGDRVSSSWAASGAIRAGMPPSAVSGVRFALEPGAGRTSVPVRSAILGAILAVTVVVATVTFGSSLSTLVSHPALYGWNWTYDMDGGGGLGDVPGQAAGKLLNADPLVTAWSGIYYSTLQLDGVEVPVMGSSTHAAVAPPLLSGHSLDGAQPGRARCRHPPPIAQTGRRHR